MEANRICIVGRGRAGMALAAAAQAAAVEVHGPLGRGMSVPPGMPTLLCVPDSSLAAVAATVDATSLVGHCSASASLDVLAPHQAFSIHPLMTLHGAGSRLRGVWCAVDGSSTAAQTYSRDLALRLGMRPFHIPAAKRALYHAAASMASNFLVTLEDAAERAARSSGVPREALVPLVEAAVAAWSAQGFTGAITGPIVRGDEETVRRQRAAVAQALPDLVPLFDVMSDATRQAIARRNS